MRGNPDETDEYFDPDLEEFLFGSISDGFERSPSKKQENVHRRIPYQKLYKNMDPEARPTYAARTAPTD